MNKTSRTLSFVGVFAAAAIGQAATFNTITGPFSAGAGDIPFGPSVGHIFEVTGAGINVTDLAFVNSSGTGLNAGSSATVGIYTYTGGYVGSFGASPVVSANITSASAASGNYAWESVGSTYLAPGFYGILASSITLAGGDSVGSAFLGDSLPTFNSGNNVNGGPLLGDAVGGTLSTPSIDNRRFKLVNFEFTPVPEPETYAMIAGLGLVGFGLWRRRQ